MIIFKYLIDRSSAKACNEGKTFEMIFLMKCPEILNHHCQSQYFREIYIYYSISVSQAFTCTLKAWEVVCTSGVEHP